jgi:hypothetical protein
MGFVRGEPIRSAPVKVLVPPFAMVCWGFDEWVLRADSAPSLATPVGPLPCPIEAFNAAVCYVRNTCAPCQGGAFQWVQAPPGNRSSRKQPEQSWR